MSRLVPAVAASALCLAATAAQAASRPIVLELFTSEGCSSCPPADALLTSLADRRDLLPLAFHVTYWNALGWRDPYSLQAATDRQALYAARLGGGSYTPEMVVDGRRGMVGSDEGDVTAAIAASRGEASAAVAVKLVRDGDALSVDIGASKAGTSKARSRVLMIGFDPRHETHVGRGENSGRTLVESNIVRSMRTIGTYEGRSAKLTAAPTAGSAHAVIVQAPDGRILGAARL